MAMAVHESPDMAKLWPVQKRTPQDSSSPPSTATNTSVLFRAHKKWRQHAAAASTVDGRKRVRLVLTKNRARARRRRPNSPMVTSSPCPFEQYKKRPSTAAEAQVGTEEKAAVVEPVIVAIPMVSTPLWRDGRATDVVDPRWIVQRLPQPLEPPVSPVNAVLENELRLLFDQMGKSGDVVYRFRAGPAPGSEYIECCDVLNEWALRLVKKRGGDEVWRLGIERLVYKVLFEYIMRQHVSGGRTSGAMDVVEVKSAQNRRPEEGSLLDMLVWLKEVAKSPCELMMSGMATEWRNMQNLNMDFSNQQSLMQGCTNVLNLNEPPCEDNAMFLRKMVICAREALFVKVKGVLPIEDFRYRTSKKQKIRHYLHEMSGAVATISPDNMDSSLMELSRSADGLTLPCGLLKQPQRRSLRSLALLKFSDSQRKRVPIGPAFQADVPDWKDPTCEKLTSGDDEDSNDSRWLGTQMWPVKPDFPESDLETAGRGRLDFCVCPSPRSVSCARYHISKSRLQLQWNLGQAFNSLGFNDMGEEVSNSWTLDEQRIFDALVKLNPLSENKSFWEPAVKLFGSKSRRDIVGYYFNVFVLRRMGIQTRLIGQDADSDDDEFNVDAYEDLYPRIHRRFIRGNPCLS